MNTKNSNNSNKPKGSNDVNPMKQPSPPKMPTITVRDGSDKVVGTSSNLSRRK